MPDGPLHREARLPHAGRRDEVGVGGGGLGGGGGDSGAGVMTLVACVVAWSGWFIFRASFVDAGKRVFCLAEDAMISMTYARNLVEGHGLNWARAGEPVEGFTSPLWTALMVPINALSLDLRYRSLLVQLLSLAILILHLLLVRRLTLRFFSTARARHWLPAAILTAFYYPLNYWALMGLESGLQSLLATASVLLALDIVCRGENRHRELLLLGAAACLLGMEMLLTVVAVQVYVIAKGGLRHPPQRAGWWQGAAIVAAAVAGYGAFRWLYFREVLPNTWYLDFYRIPAGVRLMRGGVTLWAAVSDQLPLLACVGIGLEVLARTRHDGGPLPALAATAVPGRAGAGADGVAVAQRMALPAGLFVLACAYSVYAGGDAWDIDVQLRADRFIVYVMPLMFILFNALINQAADWIAVRRPEDVLARRFLVAIATVLAFAAGDGLWLAADNAGNWMALIVANPPPAVKARAALYGSLRELQGRLGSAAVVATGAAGIPAYFTSYKMVDVLGRNERTIARLPPAIPLRLEDFMEYAPGHVKWDYPYVLARYHPDAILDLGGPGDLSRLLRAAGYHHLREGGFWLLERPAASLKAAAGRPGQAWRGNGGPARPRGS